MSSPLHQLRAHLAARASACGPLSGVATIFGSLSGDAEEQILAEVQQLKACIYIFQPLPMVINPGLEPIVAEQVDIRVRIITSLVINPNLDPFTLVATILGLYHGHDPAIENVGRIFAPERPLNPIEDEDLEIYDLIFHTTAILQKIQ